MKLKQKLINTIALLTLALIPAGSLVGTTYAAPEPSCGADNTSKGQVLKGLDKTGDNCKDDGVNNAISTIVNILSIIVGVAAVIMIIVSGFRFVTSAGDSGKVGTAKSTLIYALVGLAIAALAQTIVRLVLIEAK